MKNQKILWVLAAVFALCLASTAQPTSTTSPQAAAGITQPPVVSTNVPAPEPLPPPLPEGRNVSYAPLVGPDPTMSNAPVSDEVATDVTFADVALPDAIRSLALQAGLNIIFDPSLLMGGDGRALTPPQVTEKWHNLTAMQALTALLDNYEWQLQRDPITKVGRITKKNPAAREPLVLTVVPLRYSNPTNILPEVQSSLSPGSAILADLRTHQLILRTTERELVGIEALILKLDAPTRQVLVEAKIIETSKDISTAKGVDWTGTLQAQHVSFGNGLTQGGRFNYTSSSTGNGSSTVSPGGSTISGGSGTSSTSSLSGITNLFSGIPSQGGGFSLNTAKGLSPATAFLNADGLSAVLSFLNTDSDSKTIAFPRTVALDGVPTELAVIQNIPIFQQTQSAPAGGSASGLATILPVYDLKVGTTILNEVGVKLVVTPRIAGPTNVLMDLRPEISSQLPGLVSETLAGQVNQAPAFARSWVKTSASVPSGYTLVMGGLDQDIVNKTFTKVPLLGDIPGLGGVFRSDSKDHTAQTVLIFVTPTIISDVDYQVSSSQFLKRKPESPSGIAETAWDSAEPYDWTKPKTHVTPAYQP